MAQNKEPTVVAQNEVTWPGGSEVVLSFDKAWRRSLELAMEGYSPVASRFIAFVRKPGLA